MTKFTRRDFIAFAGAAGVTLTRSRLAAASSETGAKSQGAATADQALADLVAGNKRFAGGSPAAPRRRPEHFRSLATAQHPFAVVVACADSRVPPEILFDTGVGDIFVVRVAGNVVDSAGVAVTGSIEYAVAELNVPLIMVLGHSNCGAVKAAIKQIDAKDLLPGAIDGLVDLIKPAVLRSKGRGGDPLVNAIRENVSIGVERLKELGPILSPRVNDAKLKVAGGVYDLATGIVTLL